MHVRLPVSTRMAAALAAAWLGAAPGFGQTPPGAVIPADAARPGQLPQTEPPRPAGAAAQGSETPSTGPSLQAPAPAPGRIVAPAPSSAGEAAPPADPDPPPIRDFEEAMVHDRMAFIRARLTEAQTRVDSLVLTFELGVLKVRKETLERRRELAGVRVELAEEARLMAADQRNKERLVELVERHGAGDWVARHLKVELEKFLHRGQWQSTAAADETALRRRLREHRQALFELGTLLFRVDADARSYARALAREAPSPAMRAELDRILADRKRALHAQERVLGELADDTARLADLKRRREDQMEDLYTVVLDRMLWLRNREPLGWLPPNWPLFGQAFDGAKALWERVRQWLPRERQRVQSHFAASWRPWAVAALVFVVLPWLAARTVRFLRGRSSVHDAPESGASAHRLVLLLALRAAVWPACLILATLSLPYFGAARNDSLGPLLAELLQVAALILWVGLFGGAVFRSGGLAERAWGLGAAAARVLRTVVRAGCAAAFLLRVPRYILLNAPGGDVAASLALARFLMIGFGLVVLGLAAAAFRRRGAVMGAALRRSRQHNGFLWAVWPLFHLAVVAILAAALALNAAGYQYASLFIWQRVTVTGLLVAAVLSLSFYLKHAVRALWRRVAARRGAPARTAPPGAADGSDAPGRAAAGAERRSGESLSAAAPRPGAPGDREAAGPGPARGGLLHVFVDLPLWLLAGAAALEVWGVSVTEFLRTPAGAAMLVRAGLIVLVVVAGLGLVRLSNAAVMSLLQPRFLDRMRSADMGRKLQTLAPLAQTSVKLLVAVSGALLILQLAGVQTGPLLAGVGIFGLAVGFAAQSLIKDIINGLFILTEGSVGAGDVVAVGGVAGVVEKVTLRSVRLRDLSGNVHFVPNSTIDHVQNMTKDFSRYLLDVGVAYREDTDEVVAVMQEVDAAMRRDPLFAGVMLEPIEIMGVDRFEDSAVIVRARLKTRTLEQWRVGREYNRRLKKAFDERGIEIPFPHRTVYWGETKQGELPLQVESRRDERATGQKAAAPPEPDRKE